MTRITRHSWTALSLTAVLTAPAHAAPAPDLPSITVPVAAEEIATQPELERLIARLRSAARSVCQQEFRSEVYIYRHACYVGTLRDALAQLERLRTRQLTTLGAASIGIGVR